MYIVHMDLNHYIHTEIYLTEISKHQEIPFFPISYIGHKYFFFKYFLNKIHQITETIIKIKENAYPKFKFHILFQ